MVVDFSFVFVRTPVLFAHQCYVRKDFSSVLGILLQWCVLAETNYDVSYIICVLFILDITIYHMFKAGARPQL